MTIACPDCGTLAEIPPLPTRAAAICRTCDFHLERTTGRSIEAALSCALATFLLLFPANLLPLMRVTMLGTSRESRIGSGAIMLWNHQWVIVALAVGLFAIVLPFVRFGLLSLVLALVRFGPRPAWLGRAFRWAIHLDAWAMPDVFLIGCAVGYSRVSASLPVTIGWGGICFLAAGLLCMLSRASLDRRTVWRAIASSPDPATGGPVVSCTVCDLVMPLDAEGSPCPRCGLRVRARKADAAIRTVALAAAGFALYLPANFYPMTTAVQIGRSVPHRIIDGIQDLIQAGLWPLAILIVCTSIAIPALKLLGLSWFVISVRRKSTKRLVLKTKLYRLIDEAGRWSNVDVFTIAVFVPLMQFGVLVHTHAGPGAPAFILVVVLTMLASRAFDPRLLWDAAFARAA